MTPPKLECLVRAKEFLARLQRRPSSQSLPILRLPPYRIIDLWYTNPMEVAPLLIIKVRYRGRRFTIIVDPDKFEGSPARELEFRRFSSPPATSAHASKARTTTWSRYGLEIWECNLYAKDERLLPDLTPLRFWTLFGIAQSCRGLAAGLLFYHVPAGMPLREALACCDEDDEDELAAWAGAIAATVEALHARGAVWGNAVEDNIVVDEDGEVWLTEHEELWVDQASDTEMERDWNIVRLIQERIEGVRAAIGEDG
ncbi:uncharacterized protein LMH87_008319 [Akanthomyces muscarius]|uniref:Protein kinase domain-containing protein n=1 Tax=Akanthomyces muscarius TaxID=2231603 RepID=A0A9W8QKX4_AKAMU|nr:uncharacterized protein LMH87_008319 [Akanthomyces muscarius]KAJ4159417.1 hypothetical protein LMH87_008319 [Akanthomyces muscarius]